VTVAGPPLRADARRNRVAILRAARAVFARHGRDAQMDDVARRAKVGVGTLYRHFPTKEALLEALAEDRFHQLAEYARAALEIDDPWQAFVTFVERGVALHANDLALSQAFAEKPGLMRASAAKADLGPLIERLVDRAKTAGVLRAEARWEDVPMIFCSLGHVHGPPRASWQRMLALVLDGLRAPGAGQLPD
jgi:AcrR family transcriptional regulator